MFKHAYENATPGDFAPPEKLLNPCVGFEMLLIIRIRTLRNLIFSAVSVQFASRKVRGLVTCSLTVVSIHTSPSFAFDYYFQIFYSSFSSISVMEVWADVTFIAFDFDCSPYIWYPRNVSFLHQSPCLILSLRFLPWIPQNHTNITSNHLYII